MATAWYIISREFSTPHSLVRSGSLRHVSLNSESKRVAFSGSRTAFPVSPVYPELRGPLITSTLSSPLSPFLCFHAVTCYPICKPFVLFTFQQWGLGYPPAPER